MTWELREVEDVECQPDDSGVYVVINRIVERRAEGDYALDIVTVRADLIAAKDSIRKEDEPIVSFVGSANAVRKHLIRFLVRWGYKWISLEHASYIGYELLRAEMQEGFVQD